VTKAAHESGGSETAYLFRFHDRPLVRIAACLGAPYNSGEQKAARFLRKEPGEAYCGEQKNNLFSRNACHFWRDYVDFGTRVTTRGACGFPRAVAIDDAPTSE
jgi:hypothetical protein